MTVDVDFNPRPPVLAGALVDDATALAWLDSLVRRLLICIGTLALALMSVALPIPCISDPAASITQKAMELYAAPSAAYLQYVMPGEGFRAYIHVAPALAFILVHPVLLYQLLAILAPPRRCPSRPKRLRVVHACTVALGAGILAGHALLQSALDALATPWVIIDIDVAWQFAEYFQM